MTVTESLLEGLKVTAVGLTIVFAVLIILMFILMLMKYIFAGSKKSAESSQTVNVKADETPTQSVSAQTTDDVNEDELVAVLTAAVAASLNTSTYNLHIKSYRRVNNTAPVWNQAGLRDTIDSRF